MRLKLTFDPTADAAIVALLSATPVRRRSRTVRELARRGLANGPAHPAPVGPATPTASRSAGPRVLSLRIRPADDPALCAVLAVCPRGERALCCLELVRAGLIAAGTAGSPRTVADNPAPAKQDLVPHGAPSPSPDPSDAPAASTDVPWERAAELAQRLLGDI